MDPSDLSPEDTPPELRTKGERAALAGQTRRDAPTEERAFEGALTAFAASPDADPPFDVLARLQARVAEDARQSVAPPLPRHPSEVRAPPPPLWRRALEALTRPLVLGPALALGLLVIALLPPGPAPEGPGPARFKGAGALAPAPSLEAAIEGDGALLDARRVGILPEGAGLIFQMRPGGGASVTLVEADPTGALHVLFREKGLGDAPAGPLSPRDPEGRPLAYAPEGPPGEYTFRLFAGEALPEEAAALWALGAPESTEAARAAGVGIDELRIVAPREPTHGED